MSQVLKTGDVILVRLVKKRASGDLWDLSLDQLPAARLGPIEVGDRPDAPDQRPRSFAEGSDVDGSQRRLAQHVLAK